MKTERGITLTILVIYVVFFSIVMGLLAALSNYVYKNIGYVNDNNIDISEFNKFNMYFIEDVKTNKQAEIKDITNEGILQITFGDGDTYRYVKNEKTIYKNKQKIAKNILDFTATTGQGDNTEQVNNVEQINSTENEKKYLTIYIKIGSNDEANYEKTIKYVLKYW